MPRLSDVDEKMLAHGFLPQADRDGWVRGHQFVQFVSSNRILFRGESLESLLRKLDHEYEQHLRP